MPKYKFKFKYVSKGLKASGDGVVEADDMDAAFPIAERGVAKDFGQETTDNVVITSMVLKP